jgi:hypothetical protein
MATKKRARGTVWLMEQAVMASGVARSRTTPYLSVACLALLAMSSAYVVAPHLSALLGSRTLSLAATGWLAERPAAQRAVHAAAAPRAAAAGVAAGLDVVLLQDERRISASGLAALVVPPATAATAVLMAVSLALRR